MEALVHLEQVSKAFGRVMAVNQLSFRVYRGDVFGFLGPNGSGKSTTLRMMLDLVRPDSGKIFLFGKELRRHRRHLMQRVGCLIERPDFYLYLSARRNLEILGRLSGMEQPRQRIAEVLELVGLKGREQDAVGTFSHGMKQRLGLAQALLHRPELLILDEPTVGLDPQGMRDIRALLLNLRSQGVTVLLSSHLLAEVEQVATRMAIIHQGRLLTQGAVSELLSEADLVVTLESTPEAGRLFNSSPYRSLLLEVQEGLIVLRTGKQQIPGLVAFLQQQGLPVYRLSYQRSLEEFFIRITNNQPVAAG